MALNIRFFCRNRHLFQYLTKSPKWNIQEVLPIRVLSSGVHCNNSINRPLVDVKTVRVLPESLKQFSTRSSDDSSNNTSPPPQDSQEKKIGLIQRFKQMYRDYWYVLVPVHMVTSTIWFGTFYYAVRSGLDVVSILEKFSLNETILQKLRDSSAGYFALALALYKLVTPLRYAATVAGTTFAIRRLTAVGWIKPVPSRERIKEMIQEKKDNIQDQVKQKHFQVMEEMRKYKSDMQNIKDKMKKM